VVYEQFFIQRTEITDSANETRVVQTSERILIQSCEKRKEDAVACRKSRK